MTRSVLLLVLLISTAHALVHVFELTLPSVEQLIAHEFRPHDAPGGKELSGALSNTWRLPFGMGALLAGWLVDRFGSRRMLSMYLLGCGAMCIAAAATGTSMTWLFGSMFCMGSCAAVYHPAGLALISHEVEAPALPRALGLHGIFGSLGIGGAPFIAGAVLWTTNP
ncbi:MAG: MFS transporter, partial [Planctomycetales bacterium]|nr:MFS transporter [Planctomycetales bacterium]